MERVLPRLWRFTAKPPLLTEVSSSQCTSLVLLNCPHKLWLPDIPPFVSGKADLCHLLRPSNVGPSLAISLRPNLSGRACCPSSAFSWPLYYILWIIFHLASCLFNLTLETHPVATDPNHKTSKVMETWRLHCCYKVPDSQSGISFLWSQAHKKVSRK